MDGRTALSLGKNVATVIADLQDICRTAAVDLSYRIGELIVDSLFEGSIERWRSEGARQVHYRELAKHPDLPLSASALCRSVGIYALCRELGGYRQWQHVGSGHVQEVLPLPLPEQARLIERAEEQKWTVKRLRAEVAKVRPAGEGRARQPVFRRVVKDMMQQLKRHHEALKQATPQNLDQDDIEEVRNALAMLNSHCAILERALQDHDPPADAAGDLVSQTRMATASLQARRAR